MIVSFRDAHTERVFRRLPSRLPPELQRRAHRKLLLIDAARTLDDLRIVPGNRLEQLTADRRGQHSIRVNRQWRICFRWRDGDAHEVEICDSH
ncbi:MAG: plasmid maintenance system killer protein [Proteobacteria bacterium]|nr:MAG: plasmid maintenance system killer protein [Pseudomonadota bacterium]